MKRFVILLAVSLSLVAGQARAGEDEGSWIHPQRARAQESEVVVSPSRTLVYAGALMLGAGYVPSFAVGVRSMNAAFWGGIFDPQEGGLSVLTIPIYGAFAYAAHPGPDYGWDVYTRKEMREWAGLALASGVVQASGLALMLVGLATAQPTPTQQRTSVRALPVAISPALARGGGSLSLQWSM